MQKELSFFQYLVNKLLTEEINEPVVKPLPTERLFAELDLDLKEQGLTDEEWQNTVEKVVMNTPRTSSKLFFNQLFGGRQEKAVIGDLLAVILNNSMYTYKVAGPQVGVEKAIMHKVCDMIGFENGDGTIAPGGSMCNYMALVMARDAKFPEIRYKGNAPKMVAYTSAESHYSIPKNAALMGLGRENVRLIPSNDVGEMDPGQFEKQVAQDIADGYTPFFVNVTAGTTVLGAFDSIEKIGAIAKKHNIWIHVDGAYCGGVIFSKKYRHLVNGLEMADSFCFNAHKMLGTPLSCSIIVTPHKKALHDSFSNDAEYLYQTDADDYNLGKTSLQCGRKNDALKFWTLWKAVGTDGLERIVDNQFYLADVAQEYVANHPDYALYSHPNSISVCYNYKDIPAPDLCTKLYEDAATLVGYGKFRDTEFVRFVTINATNTKEDILNFFKVMEAGA